MIFGKHINKYYLRYSWLLILGLIALVAVDYFQLLIPEYLRIVLNGINTGEVTVDGTAVEFNMQTLLTHVCFPLLIVIAVIVAGRFGWRMCFLGAGEKDVIKIVLLFAFILSVFTFLLAIGFTLAGYYGFLYPAFYTPKYGVSEFVLNGWNFLVLAVLSFGVPLLCSVVPLKKFLKKSIVDNISGNIKAR